MIKSKAIKLRFYYERSFLIVFRRVCDIDPGRLPIRSLSFELALKVGSLRTYTKTPKGDEWKFSEIPKKSRKLMEELELHIVKN